MVRAFIDDSGNGGDHRYFVLAGYAADAETWKKFSEAWQSVLTAKPQLAYFKMSEAQSRTGAFSGFSERQRDDKVNAFIDVILNHDVFEGSRRAVSDMDTMPVFTVSDDPPCGRIPLSPTVTGAS